MFGAKIMAACAKVVLIKTSTGEWVQVVLFVSDEMPFLDGSKCRDYRCDCSGDHAPAD